MAKNTKRRRVMGRYIKGNVDEELGLGTLASKTLINAVFDDSVAERTLISSLVATYTMADFTAAVGDGPILVGIAHSDYSASEIEAVIEAVNSWDEADKIGLELGKRLVRKIGEFPSANIDGVGDVALNSGLPIKTKLNWILNTSQTLQLWAYNVGSSALATTSPVVRCQGHANLWPR